MKLILLFSLLELVYGLINYMTILKHLHKSSSPNKILLKNQINLLNTLTADKNNVIICNSNKHTCIMYLTYIYSLNSIANELYEKIIFTDTNNNIIIDNKNKNNVEHVHFTDIKNIKNSIIIAYRMELSSIGNMINLLELYKYNKIIIIGNNSQGKQDNGFSDLLYRIKNIDYKNIKIINFIDDVNNDNNNDILYDLYNIKNNKYEQKVNITENIDVINNNDTILIQNHHLKHNNLVNNNDAALIPIHHLKNNNFK